MSAPIRTTAALVRSIAAVEHFRATGELPTYARHPSSIHRTDRKDRP